MEIDTARIRALLNQRDEIDELLKAAFSGTAERKEVTCGSCGGKSHTARSCPQRKMQDASKVVE